MISLFSCKKETVTNTIVERDTIGLTNYLPPSTPYYIKATIDGVAIVDTINVAATMQAVVGLNISASNSSAYNSDNIILTFKYLDSGNNVNFIGTGIYTDTASNFFISTQTNPYGVYMQMELLGKEYQNIPGYGLPLPPLFTATITQINDSTVRGTFSGEVQYGYSGATPSKVITNGSFYVPF
jgi:hypothetical protein